MNENLTEAVSSCSRRPVLWNGTRCSRTLAAPLTPFREPEVGPLRPGTRNSHWPRGQRRDSVDSGDGLPHLAAGLAVWLYRARVTVGPDQAAAVPGGPSLLATRLPEPDPSHGRICDPTDRTPGPQRVAPARAQRPRAAGPPATEPDRTPGLRLAQGRAVARPEAGRVRPVHWHNFKLNPATRNRHGPAVTDLSLSRAARPQDSLSEAAGPRAGPARGN